MDRDIHLILFDSAVVQTGISIAVIGVIVIPIPVILNVLWLVTSSAGIRGILAGLT